MFDLSGFRESAANIDRCTGRDRAATVAEIFADPATARARVEQLLDILANSGRTIARLADTVEDVGKMLAKSNTALGQALENQRRLGDLATVAIADGIVQRVIT